MRSRCSFVVGNGRRVLFGRIGDLGITCCVCFLLYFLYLFLRMHEWRMFENFLLKGGGVGRGLESLFL